MNVGRIYFILFLLALAGCVIKANPNQPQYDRYSCAYKPRIYFCDDFRYNESDINFVVDWYNERGYNLSVAPFPVNCDTDIFIPSSILIGHAGQWGLVDSRGELGVTETTSLSIIYYVRDEYYDELILQGCNRVMLDAKIEILVNDRKVIAHEIGHGLGWRHIPIDDHLMNSYYEKVGWEDDYIDLNTY